MDKYLEWVEPGEIRTAAIPFAIDAAGSWRDVDDVERGLACDCRCPACRGPLVARQGEVRVHHFAHHDRRECRHALEASLFGMAVSILSEPTATLRLPPIGSRRKLAAELGVDFTDAQERKFYDTPWVIPAESISMAGATIVADSIEASVPDQPDIVISDRQLAVHLISHRKQPQKIREIVATQSGAVLGIDLRAYAKIWWEICDERKDERLKRAQAARGLMRDWLAQQESGRGWLLNSEFEKRREKFRTWAEQQKARLREIEGRRLEEAERRRREALERSKREDDAWRVPEIDVENHPDPDAIGWVATAQGLVAKQPEMMKVLREDAQRNITEFQAANLGLHWHDGRKSWTYVATPPAVVPPRLRGLLSPDSPWVVVTREERHQLRHAEYSPPHAAPRLLTDAGQETAVPVPSASAPADEIVRADVGYCVQCGAPTNEVIFGSGLFAGKRGILCSREKRHPMTML